MAGSTMLGYLRSNGCLICMDGQFREQCLSKSHGNEGGYKQEGFHVYGGSGDGGVVVG
jgi:hypothetical protein